MERTELYDLLAKNDLIDEVSSTLYYLGLLEKGGAEDTPTCLIVKMEKSGNVWSRKYVNGNETAKDQVWNDRTVLDYRFKR